MLHIGEFAGMTGLSVKALRHYDEKGVLVPADVDPDSGYRRYGEEQVRSGVIVKALRDAGVPLAAVGVSVAGADPSTAIDVHHRLVLEQREQEDHAFAQARSVVASLAAPVEIVERALPPQPYVGRVLTVPRGDEDAVTDDDANEQFSQLYVAVQEAGVGPTGTFWTALRPGEQGAVEIVCCWPTSSQLEPTWGGDETTVDVLPERTELAAVWRPEPGVELEEGSTHPAVVALFDAIAERGITMPTTELRQRVLGQTADEYTVEVSITLP